MVHWHPVPVANQLLILIIKLASYILSGYVLPHMRILSHTRMGRPIRVWDNIMSHTRMGVPYEYSCMIIHSYTTCTPGINFCLLTKY